MRSGEPNLLPSASLSFRNTMGWAWGADSHGREIYPSLREGQSDPVPPSCLLPFLSPSSADQTQALQPEAHVAAWEEGPDMSTFQGSSLSRPKGLEWALGRLGRTGVGPKHFRFGTAHRPSRAREDTRSQE